MDAWEMKCERIRILVESKMIWLREDLYDYSGDPEKTREIKAKLELLEELKENIYRVIAS